MDIISHAVAGASVGFAYGRPILGAFCGVFPDLVLGVDRHINPPEPYNATHSLTFVALVGIAGALALGSAVPFLAVLSHIILDYPTHGPRWAPTLFYPMSKARFGHGLQEWEWGNATWWRGLVLTLIWSLAWLFVALK